MTRFDLDHPADGFDPEHPWDWLLAEGLLEVLSDGRRVISEKGQFVWRLLRKAEQRLNEQGFESVYEEEPVDERLVLVFAVLDEFDALDYRKQKAVSQREFAKTIRDALDGVEPKRWSFTEVMQKIGYELGERDDAAEYAAERQSDACRVMDELGEA